MKTISKIMLTALSLALVACGTLGGGDTDMSNDPSFQQVRNANVNFWRAKEFAYRCVGKEKEANDAKASGDASAQAKNPSQLSKDESSNAAAEEFKNKSEKLSEEAKEHFKTSAKCFFKGFASEAALAVVLAQKVKEMQEQIQNASPMEKMSLASKLTPYADMLQMVQNDVTNAAVTSKLYIDYGIMQGLDMTALQEDAKKEAEAKAQTYVNQ